MKLIYLLHTRATMPTQLIAMLPVKNKTITQRIRYANMLQPVE